MYTNFTMSPAVLTALTAALNEEELVEKRVKNYEGIKYALKMTAGKAVIDNLPPMYLGVKKAAYVAIRKTYEVFCSDRELLNACVMPQDILNVMANKGFFDFDLFNRSQDEAGKAVVVTAMDKFSRAMTGENL